ncbi:long-chain fatty acid--CoA ligase [candidate division KSB1 bacterium]|nr:AMP-binding protein [candidate division KSB1 bacterium]RQW05114.1 MAG: long-chain fatty acid--CoA ligase [candidate division KSB1 bacterium]
MAERTLVQLFEDSIAAYGDNILMWEKKGEAYEGTTYRKIQESVYKFAAGLLTLGIQKGDRIALIAEGRNEWVISELGILYAGAINVPMSVKINESSDLKFRLSHSGCRMVVVSDRQLPKILTIQNDLPDLEKIIVLDTVEEKNHQIVLLNEIYQMGEDFLQRQSQAFFERWGDVKENDAANICYTSGTTADPKGIILTHRNYTANVEQASSLLPIPEWYTSLLILPWDHSFAHTAGIYTLMKNGASMSSVQVGKTPMETLKNIPVNIKETGPVFLLSVPSLAQNFRKNIEKGIRQKGPKVEKLFEKALKLAYKYNGIGWDRGKGLKIFLKPMYALYDKILFSKIRGGFGGRLEFFIGGGALLDIELQRFFYAIGMPMYQGYGLTEAAPIISANVPAKHKLGSSGSIVANLDVKICDDQGNSLPVGEKGEIVVRGENVMAGYWKNEKATNETLRDGWLYTGDLGYLDRDGFLYVLGRQKSLLISNDGEKYSPEGIEEALMSHSNYIDQVMLYNNQSAYTVALLVLNQAAVAGELKDKGYRFDTEEGQDTVLKLIESEIDEFRQGKYVDMFPSKWLPASFAVLGEGFTEQNGFLNSTLKMVRGKITEFYQARIDYMYTPEGKDIYNHQNRTILSRFKQ